MIAIAATVVAGCSTGHSDPPPPATVTVTAPAPTSAAGTTSGTPEPGAPASGDETPDDCAVNPASAPVPTVEPYGTVPEEARISTTVTGVPSGRVSPGGAPAEIDVTMCNDTAVDYPNVGVVLALSHCSCATNPMRIPQGTVERYDEGSGTWIPLKHPVVGGGMDYLGGYANVQPLPKGKVVTLRYRIALDASMTEGDGGVQAAAVVPEPLNQIGSAELRFSVS